MKCDVFDKNTYNGEQTFIGSVEIRRTVKDYILSKMNPYCGHSLTCETVLGGFIPKTKRQKQSIDSLKGFLKGRKVYDVRDLGTRFEVFLEERDLST